MLAISPQFSSSGWLLDDPIPIPIIHHQQNLNYFYTDRNETSNSIHLHSPNSSTTPHHNVESGGDFHNGDGQYTLSKKLNHNASERERRKKINTLYDDLRSLLPPQDQSKKLSIPATVSRVLKYIPELQKEVEGLIQKKQRLLSKISKLEKSSEKFKKQKISDDQIQNSCSSAVSVTQIGDGEIIIQCSIPRSEKGSFSEAIKRMEDEGFLMINASCFQSFQGRLFYNLHLQAEEGEVKDADILKEKVWPLI